MNKTTVVTFNFDEARTLEVITKRGPVTLTEIARIGFPGVRRHKLAPTDAEHPGTHPAYRKVANALRKLRRIKAVKLVDKNKYIARKN